MRYFSSAFAGVLVGVVLAAVVLYYNPLTTRAARKVDDAELTLRYSVPDRDLIALTHDERLPLPLKPEAVETLWERGIRSAALSVLTLHEVGGDTAHADAKGGEGAAGEAAHQGATGGAADGDARADATGGDAADGLANDGPVSALATRLTVPSQSTDLLLRGALLDDYWLVTVPGQGSLFVHDVNNLWPALRENVVPVSLLDRAWRGPAEYRTTLGPRTARGPGFVLGASGRFAGVDGDAGERYRLNRYSRAHGAEDLVGELDLDLSAPASDTVATAAADAVGSAGAAD
jgi:hypothetical protein